MKEIVAGNRQFFIMCLLWVVSGMIAQPLGIAVVAISVLLMSARRMYLELLVGFFVILTLSDSRQHFLAFASDAKNIYIVVMALTMMMVRKNFSPYASIHRFFIPFIIIALFSIFNAPSENLSNTVQKSLSFWFVLMVVPTYLLVAWREYREQALMLLLWTGTLLLLIGFVLRFVSPGIVFLEGRYCGVLGNPNGLGLFCTLFFFLAFTVRKYWRDKFDRRTTIIIFGSILLSLVMSGSRNSLLTFLIFLLFSQLYKLSPFIGFIIFVVICLGYQLLLSNAESIIIGLGLEQYFRLETLQNGSGRLIAWQFGWENIQKSPVLGQGISYTEYLYRKNYVYLSMLGHQGNAHNSYITFWLDGGLFGLLAYLGGLLTGFIRSMRRSTLAIPVLYAILFSAFFESWLTASLNPFTIQLLLLLTIYSQTEINLAAAPDANNAVADNDEKAPYPVH